VPLAAIGIDIAVGYRLEIHLRSEVGYAFDTHGATDLILTGREGTDTPGEGLRLQFVHLALGEGRGCEAHRGDVLREDEVIVIDDTVFLRKDGTNVAVELQGKQYDEHTQQVGYEEAEQLQGGDVLTKKFPNHKNLKY